eukprot:scaffold405565_cov25-Prasinocladus_malaysianus.AAC.1
MAPELLMDCKLSYPADVYSFGAPPANVCIDELVEHVFVILDHTNLPGMVLWEIYHSRRPFEGMLHAQIIAQVALRN